MNYDIGEFYPFRRNGSVYFMALPSCSIWRGDEASLRAMEELRGRTDVPEAEVFEALVRHGGAASVPDALESLKVSQLLRPTGGGSSDEPYRRIPVEPGIVTSLVCNVAHACNLTCTYCYAEQGKYGGRSGLMDEATARRYVDFLMDNSGDAEQVALTFFGGEPLLNYPVIVSTVRYGQKRASERGKKIKFDLTTNATLLDEEKIRFLNENRIMVTVSIDGPREVHDGIRTHRDGSGSYDEIVRNLGPFLKSRPVPARVTMTRRNLQAKAIVDHLLELGFAEVGISPVDVMENAETGLREEDMDGLMQEFERVADHYLESALAGRYYGFSNVTNLLKQFHDGVSKAYPCGAGMQLAAGDPDGNLYLCHRMVGRSDSAIGTLDTGIDRERQADFLNEVNVLNRGPCRSCWIRYICSGGCYYTSALHYNDHARPYLPKCDWLRAWFHKNLEIYVTLLENNPAFIEKYAESSMLC
jgi:uncharacterized protein